MDQMMRRLARRAEEEGLVDVAYTTMDSPLGKLLLAATPDGLVRLSFDTEDEDSVLEGLARRVSPRVVEAPSRLDAVRRELDEYFAGDRTTFDVALDWRLVGDGFRRRVLEATARIPYGVVSTYTAVATEAGNRAAQRATGNALGSNPIAVIVPCHRVLRSDGSLGGYGGRLDRKELLLALETRSDGLSGAGPRLA